MSTSVFASSSPPIVVTRFARVNAARGERGALDLSELRAPQRISRAQLVEDPRKPGRFAKPDTLGGYAFATFAGDHRKRENVEKVTSLVLDFDDGKTTIDTAADAWPYGGVLHTSFNSTTESPRFRIVCRLSRDLSRDEHATLWTWADSRARSIGQTIDPAPKDASRFWYEPAVPEDVEYVFRDLPGEPLDVDAIFASLRAPCPANDTTSTPNVAPSAPVPQSDPSILRRAAAYLRTMDPGVQGENGSGPTFKAALAMVRGFCLSKNEALELLLSDAFNARCSPPWTRAELVHKITDAERDGQVPMGYLLAPTVSLAAVEPLITTVGVERIFAELPPIDWTVQGLAIAPGPPTKIAGASFSGKTVFVQSIALSIASGRDVFGLFSCKPGLAIHVDAEQGQRVTFERYQRLARPMKIDPKELQELLRVAMFPAVRLDGSHALDAYSRLCEGARLVILDSFRALTPTLEENSSEMRGPLDMLAAVSDRTGATFLVIDHVRKTSEADVDGDPGERVRGSSAKRDALQALFVITNASPDGPKRVDMPKERVTGTPLRPFGFRVEDVPRGRDPRWGLRVTHLDLEQLNAAPSNAAGSRRLDAMIQRISDYLAAHTPFAGSKAALAKVVGGHAADFYAALSVLESRGLATVERVRNKGVTISWAETALPEALPTESDEKDQ